MNWMLAGPTALMFLICLAGVAGVFALAIRIEREDQHRKARRFYKALASTSPDQHDQDLEVVRAYQREVWGDLR